MVVGVMAVSQNSFAQQNQQISKVWVADQGDGTYINPILHADYSDPDVVRVGEDFYMTASSFNATPGLPILHSKDLVNWTDHGVILDLGPDVSWADGRAWAPAMTAKNGLVALRTAPADALMYCSA